jgi:pantoate--beta-alanine ligase
MSGVVIARTRAELRAALAPLPAPRGVVMTMGALHEGHAELMRQAREKCSSVVATLFVNPLQFGAGEDLDRYPRTFDTDLALCQDVGVDVLFAPDAAQLYPYGRPATTVSAGPLGDELEGASRPGHFDGVLTVVLKLLHLTQPDLAYFGEKDFQQLTLIRQLVADLDLDVEIVAVPTVREPDGLARSSRNRFLDPAQREAALALSRALRAGRAAGIAGPAAALNAARAKLAGAAGLEVDYLVLRSPDLKPVEYGPARLLVAARTGTTRLIDNSPVELFGPIPTGSSVSGTDPALTQEGTT